MSVLLLIAVTPLAFAVTITSDKDEYHPGDQLIVSGTAGPNEDLTFKVTNPNGAQVAVGQVAADDNGDFSITLLRFPSVATTTFPFGSYTVTATAGSGSAELTVTLTETTAAAPSQPAASQESGGFAVTVTSEGTYNAGDTVSIYVLTTEDGVLTDATISVASVKAPNGAENVLSTCGKVSTGLQRCSYNVAGGIGTYAVLVSAFTDAGSSSAIGTFQVSAGAQPHPPQAAVESNAPILNAIANVASDLDNVGNDVNRLEGNFPINIPRTEIPEGVSLAQISSALDAAVADLKSAVSGSQSAIQGNVDANGDDIVSAIDDISANANAAAQGSSQAASTALIAAVLAAIAVILQIVIIVRGNLLKN